MKKIIALLILVFITKFYGQNEIKNMENVKRNYESGMKFLHYDSKKKDLDYLKHFKAENDNKSILIFYMLSKDSLKIINGEKIIIEDRFPVNSTSVRSIQAISNEKNLEILFYKNTHVEKIIITADDMKKYKFIYISPKVKPILVEYTNKWKMFI